MSEIGKLKLALFKDKMDSLVRLQRGDKVYDDTYPISIELSLTNNCNLNCVWCCDSILREKYSGNIDKGILFKLFKALARGGTKGVTVEGGGEPTMHPDFREIVHSIRECNMKVGLITNGLNIDSVLPDIDYYEWIRVSLDADSPENFERYKGKDAFGTVLKNIEKLALQKKKTVLGVGYVATRYNLGNIEGVVEMMRDVCVDYFYLRPIEDNLKYSSRNDMDWLRSYSTDVYDVVVNYYGRIEKGNSGLPCLCHSLVAVISADASVYICGRLHSHEDHRPLGNLKDNSFNEIWNGKERIEMTKQLFDREFTARNCPVCRITKYNEFINEIANTRTENFI